MDIFDKALAEARAKADAGQPPDPLTNVKAEVKELLIQKIESDDMIITTDVVICKEHRYACVQKGELIFHILLTEDLTDVEEIRIQ